MVKIFLGGARITGTRLRAKTALALLSASIFVFCFSACASKKNQAASQTETAASQNVNILSQSQPAKALAPNTAKVTAVVLNQNPKTEGMAWELRILNILGYGSGTPAIAANSQLTVQFPKSAAGQTFSLAAGDTLVLSIKHFPTMQASSSDPAAWIVATVHSQEMH